MPAHRLVVVAYGLPAPQGSKRHVGNGVMIESNAEHVRTWREDVKLAALRALEEEPEWDREHRALVMHVTFFLPRIKSHYRTGQFAHLLRENAPQLHGTKPDLDKLLRSTGDALTSAGVYADDSRIAQVYATKRYPTAEPSLHRPWLLDRPGAGIVLEGVPG